MSATTFNHPPGRKLALAGSLMQLALVLGMAGTVVGLMQALARLEKQAADLPDPGGVSAAVGEVLIPTVVGGGIALVGSALMTIALVSQRYRARWFFWVLLDGLILALVLPPIGLFFLIYGLVKRREFSSTSAGALQPAGIPRRPL